MRDRSIQHRSEGQHQRLGGQRPRVARNQAALVKRLDQQGPVALIGLAEQHGVGDQDGAQDVEEREPDGRQIIHGGDRRARHPRREDRGFSGQPPDEVGMDVAAADLPPLSRSRSTVCSS